MVLSLNRLQSHPMPLKTVHLNKIIMKPPCQIHKCVQKEGPSSLLIPTSVLDSPGPCGKLTVSRVTEEKCTLAWSLPQEDGGAGPALGSSRSRQALNRPEGGQKT